MATANYKIEYTRNIDNRIYEILPKIKALCASARSEIEQDIENANSIIISIINTHDPMADGLVDERYRGDIASGTGGEGLIKTGHMIDSVRITPTFELRSDFSIEELLTSENPTDMFYVTEEGSEELSDYISLMNYGSSGDNIIPGQMFANIIGAGFIEAAEEYMNSAIIDIVARYGQELNYLNDMIVNYQFELEETLVEKTPDTSNTTKTKRLVYALTPQQRAEHKHKRRVIAKQRKSHAKRRKSHAKRRNSKNRRR